MNPLLLLLLLARPGPEAALSVAVPWDQAGGLAQPNDQSRYKVHHELHGAGMMPLQ
jgi:hypothetical protein